MVIAGSPLDFTESILGRGTFSVSIAAPVSRECCPTPLIVRDDDAPSEVTALGALPRGSPEGRSRSPGRGPDGFAGQRVGG